MLFRSEAADGTVLSGWSLRNARAPARVAEAHSETAYMTDRALDFMREAGDSPWVLHLSYIKPHWPYIAPRPYANMFGPGDIAPAVRHAREREAHPVLAAFQDMPVGRSFTNDETRSTVIPTYMGLVKQIDDHLGRIMTYLESSGRLRDTLIVFTSDHGDYLGDHWLGEKELFHDASARIPLLISDPDPSADATRGTTDARLVEAIDIDADQVEIARRPGIGQDRVERKVALDADIRVEQLHVVAAGVGARERHEPAGIAFDQCAAPALLRDQGPGVAVMLAVPGAELAAKAVSRPDDFQNLGDDSVLAELRCHVARELEQVGAVRAPTRSGNVSDDRHCVQRAAVGFGVGLFRQYWTTTSRATAGTQTITSSFTTE